MPVAATTLNRMSTRVLGPKPGAVVALTGCRDRSASGFRPVPVFQPGK